MIKILEVEYKDEDGIEHLYSPTFFCDFCDEEIKDHHMGLVIWLSEYSKYYDQWPGYAHVHKGLCDHMYVRVTAHKLGLDEVEPHTMSLQLNTWVPELQFSGTKPKRKTLRVVAAQGPRQEYPLK